MKTDLVLVPFEAGVGEMVEIARLADRGGFDTVWTYDHFSGLVVGRRWSRDPFVTLTAIAAATRRVNVGVLVANVANRHPAQLACAVNSLQSLAPGRVVLGIGAGASATSRWSAEAAAVGRPVAGAAERRALLIESIEAFRATWRGDGYVGHHVSVAASAAIVDGAPAPPIIVGAGSAATLKVACDVADGANLLPGDDLAARVAMLRATRPDSFDISVFAALDRGHPLGGDPEPLTAIGVDRRTLWVNTPYPADAVAALSATLP